MTSLISFRGHDVHWEASLLFEQWTRYRQRVTVFLANSKNNGRTATEASFFLLYGMFTLDLVGVLSLRCG